MDNLLVDEPVNMQLVNREIKLFKRIIYIYIYNSFKQLYFSID